MRLGMVGLGRMGGNLVRRLGKAGIGAVVWDRDPAAVAALAVEGAEGAGHEHGIFVGALVVSPADAVLFKAEALVEAEGRLNEQLRLNAAAVQNGLQLTALQEDAVDDQPAQILLDGRQDLFSQVLLQILLQRK
jgi:NAD(P)-dependent dehydrogenase (short-subunit alcohol dehydrogenase family)